MPTDTAPVLPALTLVLGGARSGKSLWAEDFVLGHAEHAIYLATGTAEDAEMSQRILDHRARRGAQWTTIEEPLDLPTILARLDDAKSPVLIDCLTLWLANLMAAGRDLAGETTRLLGAIGARPNACVAVSNEVGLGIVPNNALARAFRDAAGRMNQTVAAAAEKVVFVAAGLPLALKP